MPTNRGNDKNKDAKAYLKGILASFQIDPADSMYQAGYEVAIKDTLRYLESLDAPCPWK